MPKKIKPSRPDAALTDDQWHSLWKDFHGHQTETIRVEKLALENAIKDFRNGELPPDLIVPKARKGGGETIMVYRAKLFEFLCDCGKTDHIRRHGILIRH
jgi:hypothetical protein